MQLNPCKVCHAPAVEQVRGEHHKDDKTVHLESDHVSDFRVHCSMCQNSTGWDRPDIEEFRRHGDGDNRRHVTVRDGNKDNVRKRWNDANPVK